MGTVKNKTVRSGTICRVPKSPSIMAEISSEWVSYSFRGNFIFRLTVSGTVISSKRLRTVVTR